jgi:hypothetical protein
VIFCEVLPEDHKYPVYIRDVDNIVEFPLQIGFTDVNIEGDGNGFTETVALVVDMHPLASVTVTV